MAGSKISVWMKHPGEKAYHTYVSDTLENLQMHVGGYIETVTVATDCVIICNEEGRLMGLPYNCTVMGIEFVGTIIFAGVDGDEFGDFPGDKETFKAMFGL